MPIPLKEFIEFTETRHKCDKAIMLYWTEHDNLLHVITQGSNRKFADEAADFGSKLFEHVTGVKLTPDMVHEDLRSRHDTTKTQTN